MAHLSESSSNDETTVTIPTDAHDLDFSGAIGSYPSATIVEISMQGSSIIGYEYSSAGQGDYWTDIGLAGVNVGGSCHGGVVVHFSASASYRYGPAYEKACPSPDSVDLKLNWSAIRRISGNGSVLRSDVISDSCGGPCRKYEGGDQTVTVRRMPAELNLTPTQVTLWPNEIRTIRASAAPDSIVGIKTPFTNVSWYWTPDSGQVVSPGPVCSGTSCAVSDGIGSGTLTCNAVVNGAPKSRSARVSVAKCSRKTGHPALDQQAIRDNIVSLWKHSMGGDEEVMAVFHNSEDGSYYTIPIPTNASGTDACNASWNVFSPSNVSGDSLVAIVHSHPVQKPGDTVFCPSGSITSGKGGSNKDWLGYRNLINSPPPEWLQSGWTDFEYWVVDGTYIYRMRPNAGKGSETKSGQTMFKWNDPNCTWS